MAGSKTSSDNETSDRYNATHQWAYGAALYLYNLAQTLAQTDMLEDGRWKWYKIIAIKPLCDYFQALNTSSGMFDFTLFNAPPGESVLVFREYFPSYHAATKDIVGNIVRTFFLSSEGKVPVFTQQSVETILDNAADGFYECVGIEVEEGMDRFSWLMAELISERDRVISASATIGGNQCINGSCWHKPGDDRPKEYKYGPLTGEKKMICQWLGERKNRNPRRLNQNAKTGMVWVIRHSHNKWEVWFKDEYRWNQADAKRRFNSTGV